MPNTPLGNTVQIRSEDNKDIIKNMNSYQKEIRREWRNKQASKISQDDMKQILEQMKQSLIKLSGGHTK